MNRYAHCHFCDDVRYEIGNKTSLIGLYSGEMLVPSVPTVIPKLCFFVQCATDVEKPIQVLTLRVSDKDQQLLEQTVEGAELKKAFEQAASRGTSEDPIKQVTIGMTLVASPYVIEKENIITVTITADGEEMTAGRLRIKVSDQSEGTN